MAFRVELAAGAALSVLMAGASQSQTCERSQYAGDTYAPAPAFAAQTDAPDAAPSAYAVEVVAAGLEHPWGLGFLPSGDMLVTEKPGRMRIIGADGSLSAPLGGVPEVLPASLSGLNDVLIDPNFVENRTIYFNLITRAPGVEDGGRSAPSVGRTYRATLSDDNAEIENLEVLREGTGGARRLAWGPDGMLFITWGTALASGEIPRSLEHDQGKVLRINTDGTIPADNPWVDVEGAIPDLYSIGHRDPEGATIGPDGALWTIEHGPRGGDELNRIVPGADYGHGTISYGREYDERLINDGKTAEDGLEQPAYFWTPSIAPSGVTFYDGDLFPDWRGDVFVGAMAMKHLVRLDFEDGVVVGEERLLWDRCVRVRDVRQGPDDALYVLTDEDDGELLRIAPAE